MNGPKDGEKDRNFGQAGDTFDIYDLISKRVCTGVGRAGRGEVSVMWHQKNLHLYL